MFDPNGKRTCFICFQIQSIWNFQTEKGSFINICHHCYKKYTLTRKLEQKHYSKIAVNNGRTSPPGLITMRGWLAELEKANGYCSYCGKYFGFHNLTLDHKISLFQGGVNDDSNIAACCKSCKSCNSSKGVSGVDEWLKLSLAENDKKGGRPKKKVD